jgi:hypothetical protein
VTTVGARFDPGWGYDRLHGGSGAFVGRAVARRAGQCAPRLYARAVMFPSLIGQDHALSASLWRKHSGASKLTQRGRELCMRCVALGIHAPDEVWCLREGSQQKPCFLGRFAGGAEGDRRARGVSLGGSGLGADDGLSR